MRSIILSQKLSAFELLADPEFQSIGRLKSPRRTVLIRTELRSRGPSKRATSSVTVELGGRLLSAATIPCSALLCVRDSHNDYEKWKELKVLRLKGVPDRFMPYKCKYDWTEYDKKFSR
ncbi:hypothetical protein GCK32_000116 [Trichostrongylus colubriformis]|uniref:Uncharacterized protein n=1 Tax=Trichostrongylus colubriformis TaxID=6319 RepID=A0AAN8FQ10_TRICO